MCQAASLPSDSDVPRASPGEISLPSAEAKDTLAELAVRGHNMREPDLV